MSLYTNDMTGDCSLDRVRVEAITSQDSSDGGLTPSSGEERGADGRVDL